MERTDDRGAAGRLFEPASAIKALIHLHVVKSEQNGLSYQTPITYHYKTAPYPDTRDAGSCPIGAPLSAQLDLATADYAMMTGFDNRMSHGIYDYFEAQGPSVMQTAADLGLTNTKLQLFSCDRVKNPEPTTLRELAKVYEAGYLRNDFLDAAHRDAFRANIENYTWAQFIHPMVTGGGEEARPRRDLLLVARRAEHGQGRVPLRQQQRRQV